MWMGKDKEENWSYRSIEQVQEAGRSKKKPFLFWKMTRAFSVDNEATLNQIQNWSCFDSNLTNPIKNVCYINNLKIQLFSVSK